METPMKFKRALEFLRNFEGKKVIRTTYIVMENQTSAFSIGPSNYKDFSYTADPIEIIYVGDTHVIYRSNYNSSDSTELRILSMKFVDTNWTSYDDIMNAANEKVKIIREKRIEERKMEEAKYMEERKTEETKSMEDRKKCFYDAIGFNSNSINLPYNDFKLFKL